LDCAEEYVVLARVFGLAVHEVAYYGIIFGDLGKALGDLEPGFPAGGMSDIDIPCFIVKNKAGMFKV